MKISEINTLKKGNIIPSLEGRIIQIYYKPPTDAQKKANIDSQDVVVEDDDGDQVKVQIIRKSMHIPAGSQGRRILFECGEGERGPDGLSADPYQGNMKVCCSGSASIRFRDEEPQKLPDKTPDKAPAKVAENTESIRRITNIHDHALTIVEIYNTIFDRLRRDDCDMKDEVSRLATTVYIECARQALVKPRVEGDPAPAPMDYPTQKVDVEKEAELEDAASPEPAEMTLKDVVNKQFLEGGCDMVKMERFLKNRKIPWEHVYDEMVARIVSTGIMKKYVDQAYDEFNGARLAKGTSEDKFYETLFKNMTDFAATARDIQKEKEEPEDEIPL